MKTTLLRLSRRAACLVLAGGLLTSCSLLPAASPRHEGTAASQAPQYYSDAWLSDDSLHYVYSYVGNGGGTILRGGRVLYKASSSDSIQLLKVGFPRCIINTIHHTGSNKVADVAEKFSLYKGSLTGLFRIYETDRKLIFYRYAVIMELFYTVNTIPGSEGILFENLCVLFFRDIRTKTNHTIGIFIVFNRKIL